MENSRNPNSGTAVPAIHGSTFGSALTMSTREIAELTSKRHDNVMRDTRAMLDEMGEGGLLRFEDTHRSAQNGQEYPIFRLPKRECLILVSGYDVGLRTRIIDRWMELEAALSTPRLPDLSDPAVLTTLLLEHASKRIEAERRADTAERAMVEVQPKIEAHDRIADSFGSVCRRIAAKNLGIPPLVLNRWMMTNGWTYQLIGSKDALAYQSKMTAGYLEHKVETGDKPDGTTWTSTSVRVTPKGMLALAKAFPPAAKAA